jgi:hypothetical protein
MRTPSLVDPRSAGVLRDARETFDCGCRWWGNGIFAATTVASGALEGVRHQVVAARTWADGGAAMRFGQDLGDLVLTALDDACSMKAC